MERKYLIEKENKGGRKEGTRKKRENRRKKQKQIFFKKGLKRGWGKRRIKTYHVQAQIPYDEYYHYVCIKCVNKKSFTYFLKCLFLRRPSFVTYLKLPHPFPSIS